MNQPPFAAAERAPDAQSPIQGYVLAVLALLASLALVWMYWRNAQQRESNAAREEFVAEAVEITGRLQDRLAGYRLVSRGAVSLFASVAQPSAEQWHDYVAGLRIEQQFPSLVGLGFAAYLNRTQLQDLQLAVRDSGRGFFTVHPPGVRERYGPVTYLEPRTPENIAATGYDMYAEPVRRAAMDAARDEGEARLTGVVKLVQDAGAARPALLMYSPVYRNAVIPPTKRARRDALQGWVYVPFRVEKFVQTSLGSGQRPVALRVVDITQGAQVLYSNLSPAVANGPDDMFTHSELVDAFGRRWQIDFQADPRAVLAQRTSGLRTTLVIGIVASLLLFGIALALARTESQAQAIAARMSESYRRSELRFRAAMEYSAIGKALLDHADVIVDVNPALAEILGDTRERLLGSAFDAHFIDGDAAASPQGTTDGVLRTTRQLRWGDGEQRHVQLTFAPVPGDIGQDIARLVQVEDITERLRAEDRIHALNRSLEARVALRTRELTQANQELESFAYSVSHDLRAPLRAIDGFSRLLDERYAANIDDAGRDYLARIRNAAGRMGELIGSLLKMSRLSRVELNLAPLDLSQLAAEVVADLRNVQPTRVVDVAIQPGLRAAGDPSLLRNLLQNLLDNAWKFTAGVAHAQIEFGAGPTAAAGMATFFVRDNGAGFASEYVHKLFRPFQRLHSQEQFVGHGIGLASVKRVVERHGGSIRAEGRPGEGATFWFTLPAVGEGE
ncbi:MAG: CHASE domain-containing protein [Luteimonas sp.]|nr:CHASE domain-containing protein [Luteimonas sp.]